MKFATLLSSLLLSTAAVFAGTATHTPPLVPAPAGCGPFDQGMHEIDLTGGYMYSPVGACGHGDRPKLTYGQGDLSLGWMLTSPRPGLGQNWLRGNWEALANVFGAGVAKGPSGIMVGGRGQIRYNFIQPDARWVPFVQLGAGGLGDDIYRHRDQRLVGSGFEFTLTADAGLRYLISPRWSVLIMADFEHVSNANTASRNVGVNAVGGMAGMGCFF